MATGNLLLGQASGAVGSLVFTRANGQQVTKARQELARYSNTLAQAIQRICISTAGQAYRHMQEVCCKSFQGIPVGKATHDEFMKRNVRQLRQNIRQADAQGLTYSDLRYFTPVGNDTLLPNAYIVSSGSLPSIITNIDSADPTHARLAGVGTTYQDVISFYGLKRGDILTFVFMQPDASGIVRARSARVVLDPWSPISGKASLDLPFIAAGNMVNCPNPGNSGEFTYLVNESGNIIYSLVNSDVHLIAAGVFASRRTAAGSWLHSDCQLTVYEDSDILNNFTLQQAIDVANGAPIAAISPDYLNNAGTTKLPASNVSPIPNEYKQIEYLEVSSQKKGPYINTGVIADKETEIEIIFEYFQVRQTATGQVLFGQRSGNNNLVMSNYSPSSSLILNPGELKNGYLRGGDMVSNGGIALPLQANVKTKLFFSSEGFVSLNDRLVYDQPIVRTNPPAVKMYLFRASISGSAAIDPAAGRIYSFVMRKHGQDIFNALPCKRIADGELGMYDIVSKTFLTNQGTNSFVSGPILL